MFGETRASHYDVHFKLFGVPIRIHPMFWLIAVLFSPFLGMGSGAEDMRIVLFGLLAWVAAWLTIFVIHEMGHALVLQRVFGASPKILLYGFGGVTIHQPYYKRVPGSFGRILISFAGPGVTLLAVGVILLLLYVAGLPIQFGIDRFGPIPIPSIFPDFTPWDQWVLENPRLQFPFCFVKVFLYSLIWMGIFWSFLNLLPIQPLDGGHMTRELCRRIDSRRGIPNSLLISIFCAVILLIYSLKEGNTFAAIFFGFFAWGNYQELSRWR